MSSNKYFSHSIKYFSQKKSSHSWRAATEPVYSSISANYGDISTFSTDKSDQIESILDKVIDYSQLQSGVLQPGLRFSMPGVMVFERPPSMQLVQYINNTVSEITEIEDQEYCECDNDDCEYYHSEYELESVKSYYIPVPWQLYIASYSMNPQSKYMITSVRMFFMNTPLNHPEVELYAPYIPNFFGNGLLCSPMFEDYWEISRYASDLSGVMASAYDWVWNTGFNADLYECIQQTVYQSPNEFVKQNKNVIFNNRLAPNFYHALSKLTVEDVVSMKWATPSYNHHFDRDVANFIYDTEMHALYLSQTDQDPDTPLPSAGDSRLLMYKEWLENAVKLPKTYSKVMDYILNGKDRYGTSQSIIPSSKIDDFHSLFEKMYSSLSATEYAS
jgi:hypothetical protein